MRRDFTSSLLLHPMQPQITILNLHQLFFYFYTFLLFFLYSSLFPSSLMLSEPTEPSGYRVLRPNSRARFLFPRRKQMDADRLVRCSFRLSLCCTPAPFRAYCARVVQVRPLPDSTANSPFFVAALSASSVVLAVLNIGLVPCRSVEGRGSLLFCPLRNFTLMFLLCFLFPLSINRMHCLGRPASVRCRCICNINV